MKILVDRFFSDHDTTLSNVFVDENWRCFGLEDEYRAEKLAGETRIPAGEYQVRLREVISPMTERYRAKFAWFDYHLHVQNVPNFEYIYIHIGNTDDHTDGCLLLGQGASTASECRVTQSTAAYKDFYKEVHKSAKDNILTIEYRDSDIGL